MKKIKKIFADRRKYNLLVKEFHNSLPEGLYRNCLIFDFILWFLLMLVCVFLLFIAGE